MVPRELTAQDEKILYAERALISAEHGEKTALARTLAEDFGITVETLYRRIATLKGYRGERRSDAGKSKDALVDKTALLVSELRARIVGLGEDVRRLSTESALKRLEAEGRIPKGSVNASTVNKKIREMGVTTKEKSRRLDAKHANKVHVFDGSGSENLYPVEQLPDGDWILKIRASSEKKQKNRRMKDSPRRREEHEERKMVYYYALVDVHSRLLFVEPTVTAGENTRDGVHFLERAWRPKGDHAMAGLPEIFYTDSGPLARGREGSRLMRNLGIQLEIHMPRRARAKGAVERPWRTLWQRFELDLVLFKGKTLLLSELKQMVSNYLREYNAKRSPGFYAGGKSREEAYVESLAGQDVRLLPEGRLVDLLEREDWRVIDGIGRVRWDEFYEIQDCPSDIIGEKVLCLKNMRGEVFVRHPRTREWLGTKSFEPVEFGEFRGFKKNINDEIMERAREADPPARFLYETAEGAAGRQERVISLAAKRESAVEGQPVGFASELAALLYFSDIAGPVSDLHENDQEYVKKHVAEHLNSREDVRILAEAFVVALGKAAGGAA